MDVDMPVGHFSKTQQHANVNARVCNACADKRLAAEATRKQTMYCNDHEADMPGDLFSKTMQIGKADARVCNECADKRIAAGGAAGGAAGAAAGAAAGRAKTGRLRCGCDRRRLEPDFAPEEWRRASKAGRQCLGCARAGSSGSAPPTKKRKTT